MSRWPSGHRWLVPALATLLLAIGSTACGRHLDEAVELGHHSGAAELIGRFVTSRAVLVVPDWHWTVDTTTGDWSFRTTAELLVVLERPLEVPLRFRLVPDEQTSRFHFTVSWDGVPLVSSSAQPSRQGSELTIPETLATAGVHHLAFTRAYGADAVSDRDLYDNRFVSLGYAVGRQDVALDADRRDRDRYLDRFFTMGVTGSGRQMLSGVLFDGPHAAHLTLDGGSSTKLSFGVENYSSAPARFALEAGACRSVLEVGPEQQAELGACVGQGPSDVTMTVEGERSGLFLWGAPYLTTRESRRPGPFVLITLDTTRRDALTPYGAPAGDTPNLQRLADGATVFDAAYATSPWTLPSHASVFTGLYPSHHGAGVADDHLRLERTTLAELFRGAGYFTAGLAGGEFCGSRWGVGQGFLEYEDPDGFETRGDRLTDDLVDTLIRHREEPLFLFANYFDPHALYRAPARFRRRFRVDELSRPLADLPVWSDLVRGNDTPLQRVIDGEAAVVPEALTYLKAAYRAEVAFMDEQIGRFLRALKAVGLYDSAFIVVVADHGELLGEGGYFTHGCRLDPELVEIPLIVKWPHQKEGRRVVDLVSQVDVVSTVLEAAGLAAPPADGVSLTAEGGGAAARRQLVLMEEHESRIHPLYKSMMVAPQLFGLQKARSREVVWVGGLECSRLTGATWSSVPCSGSWRDREPLVRGLVTAAGAPEPTSRGQLSDEERQRLRALGYVR